VSLVVGPAEVIVRPWGWGDGYLIRDGQPASDLRGMLACGPALPGPRPGQVWVQTGEQDHPRMVLVGRDGRPTGGSVPGQGYEGVSDGAGYVLVDLVGGTYDARPDGLHRITIGSVLATGPTGWLAEECDDRHHCTMDVIDRRSGAHRPIGPARDVHRARHSGSTPASVSRSPRRETDPPPRAKPSTPRPLHGHDPRAKTHETATRLASTADRAARPGQIRQDRSQTRVPAGRANGGNRALAAAVPGVSAEHDCGQLCNPSSVSVFDGLASTQSGDLLAQRPMKDGEMASVTTVAVLVAPTATPFSSATQRCTFPSRTADRHATEPVTNRPE